MPNNYCVFRIDRADKVVEVDWITAAGDDEAIAASRAMRRSGRREIWQGERLVATIHVTTADEPSAAFWL